ncbi:hypothetical protein QOZ80_8AG0627580 [Eleusine coracana subsp. coracana]|nr:hypothetical protein QOZ80_8AG0627580 [Eleusine coracana subsp. coracana]
MGSRTGLLAILVTCAIASLLSSSAQAQLKVGYYRETCYKAEHIVRQEVASVLSVMPKLAGSLLRLHFHDCFVRGCDGSILLDSTDNNDITIVEKKANTSASLRGFDVIDSIKEKLEEACPGTVSCADILAIVARDAVNLSGGPFWQVQTGRLDGRISNANDTKDLPPPDSDIEQLQAAFAVKNLTRKDLVVLSGAHTIGFSHCDTFRDRLHTGGNEQLDPAYQNELEAKCRAQPVAADATVQMAPKSSQRFDTGYYWNVAHRRGLFRSDAVLLADDFTAAYVQRHATGRLVHEFFADFGEAMVNMGSIQPATTGGEEVRRKCSVVNS